MSTPPPPQPPPQPAAAAAADGSSSSSFSSAVTRYPGPPPQRQACAACKHQRRKCKPDCALAPYFPADQHVSFINSYRLFGIKNIVRFLEKASPANKADAMKSVKFEAAAWAEDPVHGAYGVLATLTDDLRRDQAELTALRQQLELCRQCYGAADHPDAAAPGFLSPGQP